MAYKSIRAQLFSAHLACFIPCGCVCSDKSLQGKQIELDWPLLVSARAFNGSAINAKIRCGINPIDGLVSPDMAAHTRYSRAFLRRFFTLVKSGTSWRGLSQKYALDWLANLGRGDGKISHPT